MDVSINPNSHNSPVQLDQHPHLIDEEIRTARGKVACASNSSSLPAAVWLQTLVELQSWATLCRLSKVCPVGVRPCTLSRIHTAEQPGNPQRPSGAGCCCAYPRAPFGGVQVQAAFSPRCAYPSLSIHLPSLSFQSGHLFLETITEKFTSSLSFSISQHQFLLT